MGQVSYYSKGQPDFVDLYKSSFIVTKIMMAFVCLLRKQMTASSKLDVIKGASSHDWNLEEFQLLTRSRDQR